MVSKKITVNIASLVERVDLLINTINSIIDQVDEVNLYLNNYKSNPYPDPKVNYILGDNSLGDSSKFWFVQEQTEGYALFLDDDLIVGDTYAEDMKKAIDEFGVVSHHGRTFKSFPITSYYKEPSYRYRCLDEVKYNKPVMICGTGVLGFNVETIKPPMSVFKKPNLADIWFSIYADSLNIPIWVLKHKKGYIQYQFVEDTIWDRKHNNDGFETKIVNETFCK